MADRVRRVDLHLVGMNDLNLHYRLLLGLSDDWKVVGVDLDLSASRVIIALEHSGGKLCCRDMFRDLLAERYRSKRTWRHLDMMQSTTEIRAAVPRRRKGTRTLFFVL